MAKREPNILVITVWSFQDALIQAYTLPYVRMIHQRTGGNIALVTLEPSGRPMDAAEKEKAATDGITWLPYRYHPLSLTGVLNWMLIFFKLSWQVVSRRVDVIHCWCTPAGALGYGLSMLFSRRLVVDSFEPHAEAMTENGTWKKDSLAFRTLFWLEKKQTQRASALIAAAPGMEHYVQSRFGLTITPPMVKPACVDLRFFSNVSPSDNMLKSSLGLEGKITCVYAGKFGGIYLKQEVFDFFAVAAARWGDRFRVLLLTSHTEEEIFAMADAAGLSRLVIVRKFVPHVEVPRWLALADFAITPVKSVPSKKYCSPIKDGEYWAMGLPLVITPDISEDSSLVQKHHAGAVLTSLDRAGYDQALTEIDALLSRGKAQNYKEIRMLAEHYRNYAIAEKVYASIY